MANNFVLARITVTAATAYLSGLCSATVTGNPNDHIGTMVSSSASHDVSLVFPAEYRHYIERGDRDTYVYYIVAPEFVEDDVTITLYSTRGDYATFEKRASLQHNRMAQVSLIVEEWDGQDPIDPPSGDGALPGLFSVSATQQVHFSQGNLQYQASTNTWRFAEHQYDCIGSANSNISSTYSGWIDLFGWGTSGWNSGAVCYQPWSTSESNSDYYPGGSYTNGLTGAYADADWAWHNAISNGGNVVHLWRSLTSAEWIYLLGERNDAYDKRGTGNINGLPGLIILPDSWTLPSGCSFTPGEATPDWTQNSYTLSQWALMEAAGAIFLPAAGWRNGTEVGDVGNVGIYRSTTPLDEEAVDRMFFFSDLLHADGRHGRYSGLPVRPVQDY